MKMKMGKSGGTNESKIMTGGASEMLGRKMPPPSDPTASGKGRGTDMKTPPKMVDGKYESRGAGITAHVHGCVTD